MGILLKFPAQLIMSLRFMIYHFNSGASGGQSDFPKTRVMSTMFKDSRDTAELHSQSQQLSR